MYMGRVGLTEAVMDGCPTYPGFQGHRRDIQSSGAGGGVMESPLARGMMRTSDLHLFVPVSAFVIVFFFSFYYACMKM